MEQKQAQMIVGTAMFLMRVILVVVLVLIMLDIRSIDRRLTAIEAAHEQK